MNTIHIYGPMDYLRLLTLQFLFLCLNNHPKPFNFLRSHRTARCGDLWSIDQRCCGVGTSDGFISIESICRLWGDHASNAWWLRCGDVTWMQNFRNHFGSVNDVLQRRFGCTWYWECHTTTTYCSNLLPSCPKITQVYSSSSLSVMWNSLIGMPRCEIGNCHWKLQTFKVQGARDWMESARHDLIGISWHISFLNHFSTMRGYRYR